MRPFIAAFFLAATALSAQDLTGTWQGTLQTDREVRIVFKIARSGSGDLRAVMYNLDQNPQPAPSSPVTVQDSLVKILIPGLGGIYEGKLNAEGNTITGNWRQDAAPLPLTLELAPGDTAWTIPEPPARPRPMAADADPAFAVATIKLTKPDEHNISITFRGHRFSTHNTSLLLLMTFSYGVQARQITGGPAWLGSEKFDIAAAQDGEGEPSDAQWKMMVRKLLADRFRLTIHHEKKEQSVYTIGTAKTGPKLTPGTGDPDSLSDIGFRGAGSMYARNASIDDLAQGLQRIVLDRPVVDQSGLAGRYDFTLNWNPDEFQFGAVGRKAEAGTEAALPDLFIAIQQQLGLKLESVKTQADVLVIDHVERPSEN